VRIKLEARMVTILFDSLPLSTSRLSRETWAFFLVGITSSGENAASVLLAAPTKCSLEIGHLMRILINKNYHSPIGFVASVLGGVLGVLAEAEPA